MIEFKVLGGLEVLKDGRDCTPTPPKVRRVLALLLVRANTVVPLEALIDELWDTSPPRSAVTTAQTYIYHLRKLFIREGLACGDDDLLVTKAPGYLLRIDPEQLDTHPFARLLRDGRAHHDRGDAERCAATLTRALELWSGPPLGNVIRGRLLDAHAVHLEEQWLRALEMRLAAEFTLGRHDEHVGELRRLVAEHPLHEPFHARLIEALHSCGRRSEALIAYQNLRTLLADELGLDPSADLRRIQQRILSAAGPDVTGSGRRHRAEPLLRAG